MAIVYADSHPLAYASELAPARNIDAAVKAVCGHYNFFGANVAINDKLYVARLPSDVRLLYASRFTWGAIAGASDVDFGDANDPDALIDGQSLTSNGSISALSSVPVNLMGRDLWRMLSYASDPGGMIDLYMTFNTEPTGDYQMQFELLYQHQ